MMRRTMPRALLVAAVGILLALPFGPWITSARVASPLSDPGLGLDLGPCARCTPPLSLSADLGMEVAIPERIEGSWPAPIRPSDPPPPTLSSVDTIPVEATTTVGGSVSFSAIAKCLATTCPAGLAYNWSLNPSLGQLEPSASFSNAVVASVDSGLEIPAGIAYDSSNGDLYVTNDNANDRFADSNVSVISGATDQLIANVPVGASPTGIAYDPDDGDLYVTNCGSENMSVINGTRDSIVATIPMTLSGCMVGSDWYANFAPVLYDPASRTIYASQYADALISVVNTTTNRVVQNITVAGAPWGMAYDPESQRVYATEATVDYVAAINGVTNSLETQIPVGIFPSGVTYDSSNGDLYVADAGTYVHHPVGYGNISVINGLSNNVEDTIFVEGYPWNVAYDPGNGLIYETDSNTSVVKVISSASNTVVGNVSMGPLVRGTSTDFAAAYDASNGCVYVTAFQHDFVSVVCGGPGNLTLIAGNVPGDATLVVNATWGGQTVQSPRLHLTVVGSAFPVISSLAAAPNPLARPYTTFINISTAGGTGPLTYRYLGLPEGCSSANVTSLACTPIATGTFWVRVFVNDSAGHSTNATLELVVEPISSRGLSIHLFQVSPQGLWLGDTAYLNVSVTGGYGTLSFAYTGLPPGCPDANRTSLVCTPSATGSFRARVYVNDSASHSVNATAVIVVSPRPTSSHSPSSASATGASGPDLAPEVLAVSAGVFAVAVLVVLGPGRLRRSRPRSGPSSP